MSERSIELPAAPDFCAPQKLPQLRKGQDARAALARERGALAEANRKLDDCRGWFESVRKQYRGEQD